jgi:hypothetical protein
MSRIRTVKPELFKHEELFYAEIASKLPLRLAFTGLLTCCDRDGGFSWRPERLKLDILPYDNIDMAEVLEALATHKFINKYHHEAKWYGYIPSWFKHQKINHRELKSNIPTPPKLISTTTTLTLNIKPTNDVNEPAAKPCLPAACSTLQAADYETPQLCSYIANNNTEETMNIIDPAILPPNLDSTIEIIFNHWKIVMNHRKAKIDNKRKTLIKNALSLGYNTEQLCNAISGCSITPHNMGDNKQGQRYDGLHIILRDADQIDRFIYNYQQPPQPIRDSERLTKSNIHSVQRWLNKMQEEPNEPKS